MVGAYLDASVLVSMLLDETASPIVDAWITRTEARLFVSDLAAAEVSSAISLAVRNRRQTVADARRRMHDFDIWRANIAFEAETRPEDVRTADSFVRRFDLKLKTPDAIHAATALRMEATLITLDRRLLLAAAALGVRVAEPTVSD